MTTARTNDARRRRPVAGRIRREARRLPHGHVQRGRWTLAEMRQRAPDWREDVERAPRTGLLG